MTAVSVSSWTYLATVVAIVFVCLPRAALLLRSEVRAQYKNVRHSEQERFSNSASAARFCVNVRHSCSSSTVHPEASTADATKARLEMDMGT